MTMISPATATVAARAPRQILASATRYTFAAVAGGGVAMGLASYARNSTTPPNADGSSPNRMDRAEARDKFSGPFAPTTILPLTVAFLAIGGLYTKGRILLPERGAKIPAALQDAARAAGTELIRAEGSKTKALYAFAGGMIFGSFGARQIVFGEDRYLTRHIPVDGNGRIVPGYAGSEEPKPVG